ncbi:hypothetical protein [Rhizobium sp. SAFR-030]|uniref:hypothetical protein n=1 Tax=Rhizobium sp. SAFR-030 TaxID=3387277 RepID=UPI003F81D9E7
MSQKIRHPGLGNVIFLALCLIVGGAIGMLIFKPLLGKNEAIGVIEIGSISTGDNVAPFEQVASLTTRIPATEFAAAVANRLSDPGAAEQLLSSVYGGAGDLSARALRDANKIEIRVRHDSEKVATERLSAAMDEVMAEHEAIATNLLDFTIEQRGRYQEMLAGAEELDQQIATEINSTTSRGADFDALLAARSKIVEQVATITQTLLQLDQSTKKPYFNRTQTLAGPSPLRPLVRSSWQTALLGAIAGFALGFIAIQMKRAIV